jgi:hypothetical protein
MRKLILVLTFALFAASSLFALNPSEHTTSALRTMDLIMKR